MFVILFGLSMDYHVFILSRIREAYDRGLKTADAVEHGITTTAGVVSSAALVMVGVFAVFALMPILDMKEMGVGLAAAVLIDATVVRAVLLPATMKLLGDWNWYLPKWLDWLPRISHEPAEAAAPGGAASEFGMSVSQSDGEGRLVLTGELDLSSAPRLAERLHELEAGGPGLIVIDLRELRYMDSSGLRELFSANQRARSEGRRVVLVKGP